MLADDIDVLSTTNLSAEWTAVAMSARLYTSNWLIRYDTNFCCRLAVYGDITKTHAYSCLLITLALQLVSCIMSTSMYRHECWTCSVLCLIMTRHPHLSPEIWPGRDTEVELYVLYLNAELLILSFDFMVKMCCGKTGSCFHTVHPCVTAAERTLSSMKPAMLTVLLFNILTLFVIIY